MGHCVVVINAAPRRQGSEAIGPGDLQRWRALNKPQTTKHSARSMQSHHNGTRQEPRAKRGRRSEHSAPPKHSKWVIRIISDKVKGASRPAASQANVALRACVLPLAGGFPARWLAPRWRAGYRPMCRGRKRPGGSGEATASRVTTLTLCALSSRPSPCSLVPVNRAETNSYSERLWHQNRAISEIRGWCGALCSR